MKNIINHNFFSVTGTFGSGAIRTFAVLAIAGLLQACGGGASTESNPVTSNSGSVNTSQYTGPSPITEDVRAYQTNVWQNINSSGRCGACHVENGQTPLFARNDDINQAYTAVLPLVDLTNPANSRLVAKVAEGHNCWDSSNAACRELMISYIERWAAASGGSGGGRQIQLVAPVSNPPGTTKSLPADVNDTLFATTVWPVLTANCAGCHAETAQTPQSPFFASSDVNDAYTAVQSKINLNNPAASRLVVRLRSEFHNCWSDCAADAVTMENAIADYSATVTTATVSAPLVFSDALKLPDGIVASGGSRYEANVIALYEFKTGSGNVALDTSNVAPDLNLTLSGDADWVGGWGISMTDGKAQGSTTASRKLYDLITATGEYSIEAWVAPANVVQEGPARIVSYSAGDDARNFTLGQTMYNYDFLQRSSTADGNGQPPLSTADEDEVLQATLQHVVATFDPLNGRRIYVNGEFTGDLDPLPAGNLNDWDDSFAFVLGQEVSGEDAWAGTIRMVAIHNRALTQQQARQNFEVGVGEKFFLLFGIGDLVGLPQSYIMFEVSQFDSYSYLFNAPVFINLDPEVIPDSIVVEGMRIGLNGREVAVGQAWGNLLTSINAADYDASTGQQLSGLGSVIALENGPENDEFFLTFERLGSNTNAFSENSPLVPADLPVPDAVSDIGVRTYDEINASMAAITGVDPKEVRNGFDLIRQQLPAVENIEGFLSAHQMAIAQLAIEYCSALVEDDSLRSTFFSGFDFGTAVGTAFGSGNSTAKNIIVSALFERISGLSDGGPVLTNAPSLEELRIEMIGYNDAGALVNSDNLYARLLTSCQADSSCNAARTRAMVKAMCGSVLGSAAVLLQ
jgi:hypothetical protein